ncbi:hypothetical protein [Mycobacterium sp. SMC-4]|uniref:hypothetical protein n=1 Tax=Mycobacterium sp. SMC-4 TaxID=2857059 RepID=UPI0021B19CB1|nr:hypothetical protein [Mycobacterium sp. SMC-4]UXA17179.1 hypothetical protein KXD98_20900 [Mycobacterium sp. SMC-4]
MGVGTRTTVRLGPTMRVVVGVAAAVVSIVTATAAGAETPSSTGVGGSSAGQGEVRADGLQGQVRSSLKAAPKTRASAFGGMGENDYRCREDWGQFC